MVLPRWTKKYNTAQGGRDFLGYMNVGVIMLERLLPGISNITNRLRYYSFFPWILYRFFKTDKPKRFSSFKKYLKIKSLAFLYANGFLYQNDSGIGLDGIEMVQEDLKNNGERTVYHWDDDFIKNYKDNYWVYSQKLKQVGVTADNEFEDGDLESLTQGHGKNIAEIYDNAIKNTEYYKKYCDQDDQKIPVDVLKEYGQVCNVMGLDNSHKEQQLLFDLIFGLDKIKDEQEDFSLYYSDNPPNTIRARRESMMLFLDIINQMGGKDFVYEDFQKIILYSQEQENGYKVANKLLHCLEYWKIFQARQFLIYAIESFFTILTSQIYNRNVTVDLLLEEMCDLTSNGIVSFKEKYNIDFTLDMKISDLVFIFSKEIDDSEINEWNLYETIKKEIKTEKHKECLIDSFALLVLLYVRFNPYREKNLPYWEFGRIGEGAHLSMDSFFSKIDDMIVKGLLVRDMQNWVIKELVIKQHDHTAMVKLAAYKNNTFHFEYSGGKIKGLKKASPHINAPKFKNVINFMEDLGLTTSDNNKVTITDKGKKILDGYTTNNN